MSTNTISALRPLPFPARETVRRDPAAQAYLLMRIAFTVAPILFGIDKFANVLTNDWTVYLSTQFNDIIPGNAATAMHLVGIVEIAREAYKDPTDEKGVFYCVDTRAAEPFKTPVTLATVKADGKLKNMVLAREPRLSVQAVTDDEWRQICKMGGVKGG